MCATTENRPSSRIRPRCNSEKHTHLRSYNTRAEFSVWVTVDGIVIRRGIRHGLITSSTRRRRACDENWCGQRRWSTVGKTCISGSGVFCFSYLFNVFFVSLSPRFHPTVPSSGKETCTTDTKDIESVIRYTIYICVYTFVCVYYRWTLRFSTIDIGYYTYTHHRAVYTVYGCTHTRVCTHVRKIIHPETPITV